MIDINKGEFALAEDLVISSGYTFKQFKNTRYYVNQNPAIVFWLDERFVFHGYTFIASLFFRNETIYMISLLCCDKDFNMEEEEKRKEFHDEILKTWGITQSDFQWGYIKSEYDSKSNISSIDIVFV